MRERVSKLTIEFPECLDLFDKVQPFTGPSLYFHFKTLAIRRKHRTAVETLNDEGFFDNLYATLAGWGMHRMGDTSTKLRDLDEIKSSFRNQAERIEEIERLVITALTDPQPKQIAQQLWHIIKELKVGIGGTKLVASSKALHHLLPSLMPPIDREYTLCFFYKDKNLYDEETKFLEIFQPFAESP